MTYVRNRGGLTFWKVSSLGSHRYLRRCTRLRTWADRTLSATNGETSVERHRQPAAEAGNGQHDSQCGIADLVGEVAAEGGLLHGDDLLLATVRLGHDLPTPQSNTAQIYQTIYFALVVFCVWGNWARGKAGRYLSNTQAGQGERLIEWAQRQAHSRDVKVVGTLTLTCVALLTDVTLRNRTQALNSTTHT